MKSLEKLRKANSYLDDDSMGIYTSDNGIEEFLARGIKTSNELADEIQKEIDAEYKQRHACYNLARDYCGTEYDPDWDGFICSECGWEISDSEPSYCPNCGAEVQNNTDKWFELCFPHFEPFTTLKDAKLKDQALKVLEEAAELVEAVKSGDDRNARLEAMDVYQALGNLIYVEGWTSDDLRKAYAIVHTRNAQRGRYDVILEEAE